MSSMIPVDGIVATKRRAECDRSLLVAGVGIITAAVKDLVRTHFFQPLSVWRQVFRMTGSANVENTLSVLINTRGSEDREVWGVERGFRGVTCTAISTLACWLYRIF